MKANVLNIQYVGDIDLLPIKYGFVDYEGNGTYYWQTKNYALCMLLKKDATGDYMLTVMNPNSEALRTLCKMHIDGVIKFVEREMNYGKY